MRKHCGNCANYKNETNQFSEECGKCVSARLENGEMTDPSHWREKPQTNADRIRAMSDEELAQELLQFNTLAESVPFCRNLAECDELLDTEDGIPEEKCKHCLLNWLRQPAEVEL